MTEQTAAFDIDSLLDGTLDDLADLPEFRPFPVGTYRVAASITQDPKQAKNLFFLNLKVLETLELSDPTETPVEVGAETRIRYDVLNQYGQGNFKKILSAFGTKLGLGKVSAILEEARNPHESLVVTKQTFSKDKTKVFVDVVELQVV